MGAWGHRSFENDDAADLGVELETGGWEVVYSAIQATTDLTQDDYLEAPEASKAVAAAEMIAAAKSGDISRLPPEVGDAIAQLGPLPDPSLIAQAKTAVERVLAQSELQELWAETGNDRAWRDDMKALLDRLR